MPQDAEAETSPLLQQQNIPTTTTMIPAHSHSSNGTVKTWPLALLRLEGAAIFGATIYAYRQTGGSWLTFGAWLLLPDLGMAGYLANTRVGAALYNAVHTETPGILMLCAAWVVQRGEQSGGSGPGSPGGAGNLGLGLARVALTWLAHVGMDRMLGFGLKYATGFGHTHLGVLD
ncbi:hypothetical protein LTR84_001077 [Exophiala bonariae]|uniref:DUF4260 domain-containing protein n=1 Tax=Exophiala bonariae TaxID=1690606 RepID=A0AAV9NU31_9EURO|nr:hypothetical protein LTR84_001077 [Exophiala bonariae]